MLVVSFLSLYANRIVQFLWNFSVLLHVYQKLMRNRYIVRSSSRKSMFTRNILLIRLMEYSENRTRLSSIFIILPLWEEDGIHHLLMISYLIQHDREMKRNVTTLDQHVRLTFDIGANLSILIYFVSIKTTSEILIKHTFWDSALTPRTGFKQGVSQRLSSILKSLMQ